MQCGGAAEKRRYFFFLLSAGERIFGELEEVVVAMSG